MILTSAWVRWPLYVQYIIMEKWQRHNSGHQQAHPNLNQHIQLSAQKRVWQGTAGAAVNLLHASNRRQDKHGARCHFCVWPPGAPRRNGVCFFCSNESRLLYTLMHAVASGTGASNFSTQTGCYSKRPVGDSMNFVGNERTAKKLADDHKPWADASIDLRTEKCRRQNICHTNDVCTSHINC